MPLLIFAQGDAGLGEQDTVGFASRLLAISCSFFGRQPIFQWQEKLADQLGDHPAAAIAQQGGACTQFTSMFLC